MNILGYIIYGICILFAVGVCLRARENALNQIFSEKSFELTGFLFSLSVVLIPILHLSPFQLLWMFPVSWIIGMLSVATPLGILWWFSDMYFIIWYIGTKNLGLKYYRAGDYEKVIEILNEKIRRNPKSSDSFHLLGLAYGKLGKHVEEVQSYQSAISIKPKRPEYHFNLATVYKENGNKKLAIDIMNQAVRLKPDYKKAHYVLCIIYSEIGDIDHAKKQFEIVKELDAQLAEKLQFEANLNH